MPGHIVIISHIFEVRTNSAFTGSEMAKLPNPGMILAGFLAHLALAKVIYRITVAVDYSFFNSVICKKEGIIWFLLIAMSAIVAFLITIKSKENKASQGILAFIGSFILNVSGDHLGINAVLCNKINYDWHTIIRIQDIYNYCTISDYGNSISGDFRTLSQKGISTRRRRKQRSSRSRSYSTGSLCSVHCLEVCLRSGDGAILHEKRVGKLAGASSRVRYPHHLYLHKNRKPI